MNSRKYTFGLLKKRILCALEETGCEGGVFFSDTERDRIQNGMADAVNAALARMYESLPLGERKAVVYINSPKVLASARSLEGSKNDRISFDVCEKTAVFFTAFGNGSVIFYDGEGSAVYRKGFEGEQGSFTPVRFLIEKGKCCVMEVVGDLHLRDICVYDGNNLINDILIAPKGYCSFTLPDDFGKLSKSGSFSQNGPDCDIMVNSGVGYIRIPEHKVPDCDCVEICYTAFPVLLDDSTSESFEFSLSPIMFEALVNLAASELCSENMPSTYTRLVYKYNDLTESCFSLCNMNANRRNSFYKSARGRW